MDKLAQGKEVLEQLAILCLALGGLITVIVGVITTGLVGYWGIVSLFRLFFQ